MRSEDAAREMEGERRPAEPGASPVKVTVVMIKYPPDDNKGRKYFSHPGGVRVREGDKLAFRASGTNAKIFFPQAEKLFEEGKGVEVLEVMPEGEPRTVRVKQGAYREDPYEFAIFCDAAGKDKNGKGLGQFAEGNSTPKVIIEPPGGDE